MTPSLAPAMTPSADFGRALRIALVGSAGLVLISWLIAFIARPDPWSSGAIWAAIALFSSSVAALVPVAIAATHLTRRTKARNVRNVMFTAIGVLALLPTIWLVVVFVSGLLLLLGAIAAPSV